MVYGESLVSRDIVYFTKYIRSHFFVKFNTNRPLTKWDEKTTCVKNSHMNNWRVNRNSEDVLSSVSKVENTYWKWNVIRRTLDPIVPINPGLYCGSYHVTYSLPVSYTSWLKSIESHNMTRGNTYSFLSQFTPL